VGPVAAVVGQVARGFSTRRCPIVYYRGPTGRGFITGNLDLAPETSLQFDPGTIHRQPARLAAYVTTTASPTWSSDIPPLPISSSSESASAIPRRGA
jgi:hypothetical protein